MKFLKFKFKSYDPSKYNCVIDYQTHRLSLKNFKKSFLKRYISSNHLEKARMAYTYVCLTSKSKRDIPRKLHCQMLSQQLLDKHLQIYWEFIQELQIVLSTLKKINLSVLLRKSIVIKRLIVSWIVSFLNTREIDSLGVQRL